MRRTMIMAAFAASAGMAALSGPASAQSVELYVGPGYDRHYGYAPYGGGYYYAPPAYGYAPPAYGYSTYRRGGGGYYERPEHFRYGSNRWWRQMDRTGRGGHQK